MSKTHLEKIDFLRGAAILAVFAYHLQLVIFHRFEINEYAEANNFLEISGLKSYILNFSPTAFGWAGVDLFLLISGFLIHYSYLLNESKFNNFSFFSKRFWRIYPPYLIALLFFTFFTGQRSYYLFDTEGLKKLIAHLFLIHNLNDNTFGSINGSFWSLALEVQLYLIYPFFLRLRKKMGIENSFNLTLAISFILLVAGIIFPLLGKSASYNSSVFKLWFIWTAGAFLAEKYYRNEKIFKRLGFKTAVFIFVIAMFLKIHLYSNHFTIYLITLSLIIFFEWYIYYETNIKTIYFRALSIIGICSYSIYLIHQPYLKILLDFFQVFKDPNYYYLKYFIPINVVLTFLFIFCVSYVYYLLIEKTSIEFGKKLRK